MATVILWFPPYDVGDDPEPTPVLMMPCPAWPVTECVVTGKEVGVFKRRYTVRCIDRTRPGWYTHIGDVILGEEA